ncbi:winged helix-turn-helix domain-containing protein [Sphingomonas xanthus]|uniref:Transcriptional regulator n=1 Tax=Sphingomonas xanthus TaxID=2594473 RepID=A0A516ITU1_9SPHN|nr:winged helix-turn-helix domain-containing protein [Sphingomonas xanthus]QDP20234.1 transcriptional regulator [Sphingomonas xanthus]
MTADRICFDRFELDIPNRRLLHDGAPVDLNARYFDALALLVRAPDELVTKDRFMAEVWNGVPVTDEALTQCIKSLRRALGDEAARPRFIETVPKHGYRFIAATDPAVAPAAPPTSETPLSTALAGTLGGGLAGLAGGLVYGLAWAAQPAPQGSAGMSTLLVLVSLTVAIGILGGAGVALGIAATRAVPSLHPGWTVIGGATGGLIVGAAARLLGLDAFNLLLGSGPRDMTGASEGALLGAAVGLAVWLHARSCRAGPSSRDIAVAAIIGLAAGAIIGSAGGQLLGGSLDQVAASFPNSRLDLDRFGALFGEDGFGPVSRTATSALEAMLFVTFTFAAITLAGRAGTSRRPT